MRKRYLLARDIFSEMEGLKSVAEATLGSWSQEFIGNCGLRVRCRRARALCEKVTCLREVFFELRFHVISDEKI